MFPGAIFSCDISVVDSSRADGSAASEVVKRFRSRERERVGFYGSVGAVGVLSFDFFSPLLFKLFQGAAASLLCGHVFFTAVLVSQDVPFPALTLFYFLSLLMCQDLFFFCSLEGKKKKKLLNLDVLASRHQIKTGGFPG